MAAPGSKVIFYVKEKLKEIEQMTVISVGSGHCDYVPQATRNVNKPLNIRNVSYTNL